MKRKLDVDGPKGVTEAYRDGWDRTFAARNTANRLTTLFALFLWGFKSRSPKSI